MSAKLDALRPLFKLHAWTIVNSLTRVGVFTEKEAKKMVGGKLEKNETTGNLVYATVQQTGHFMKHGQRMAVLVWKQHILPIGMPFNHATGTWYPPLLRSNF